MVRTSIWLSALLSLAACATEVASVNAPATSEQDQLSTAGMLTAPAEPTTTSGNASDGTSDAISGISGVAGSLTPPAAVPAVPDESAMVADGTEVGSSGGDTAPATEDPATAAMTEEAPADGEDVTTPPASELPTPVAADPAATPAAPSAPAFTSLADLEPSPNNIAECPATAPEDPWGPCIGVPVYAVCDYGTEPTPFYTCVCDWIHWICVGFQ